VLPVNVGSGPTTKKRVRKVAHQDMAGVTLEQHEVKGKVFSITDLADELERAAAAARELAKLGLLKNGR
jgi:hypothetical protein